MSRKKIQIAGGVRERPIKKAYGLKGVLQIGNDSDPTLPAGEVERRNSIRHGSLRRLYDEGAIEATVHPRGGVSFTVAQEAEAIRVCGERGLFFQD